MFSLENFQYLAFRRCVCVLITFLFNANTYASDGKENVFLNADMSQNISCSGLQSNPFYYFPQPTYYYWNFPSNMYCSHDFPGAFYTGISQALPSYNIGMSSQLNCADQLQTYNHVTDTVMSNPQYTLINDAALMQRVEASFSGIEPPLKKTANYQQLNDYVCICNTGNCSPQDAELTKLMHAACNGHLSRVQVLMSKESRMQDAKGMTALMFAARNGHLSCVQALIKKAVYMTRMV